MRARIGDESGLTLVELLVAAAMSVVLVGAACAMLISAVRAQPTLSEKTQEISTARYVLERMTREIRNGIFVYPEATGAKVEFQTRVRHSTCGGEVTENPATPSIECRVTYSCATASPPTAPPTYSCSRAETDPDVSPGVGTPTTTIITGLASSKVFNYEPNLEEPTFVGITLHIANPEGEGELTVTDGAGLRIQSYLG